MLALCVLTSAACASPPATWFVEGSVARVLGPDGFDGNARHEPQGGTTWNVTLGRQTLAWLAFTGEAELLHVDEQLLGAFVPEDIWTVDGATHAALMPGVRLGPPLDRGLTPSFELATGVGLLHWGDRHVADMFSGRTQTIAGEREVTFAWSAGFRLRYATRPRMLTPVAAARAIGFYEPGNSVLLLTLGLGLRY